QYHVQREQLTNRRLNPDPPVAVSLQDQHLERGRLEEQIGLGSAISIVGLIGIEFVALGRVANYVLGVPVRAALAVIAVPFIAVDAISLINPQGIYEGLLRPALIA